MKAGWVEKSLDQIGMTKTGTTPKTLDQENYGDFIPFIKPADFNKNGTLNYENDGLSELGLRIARPVKAGSVLMVCIGATIGKCGFCDRDVTMNQQINSVTTFSDVSHKFVYYQMLTESFQRQVFFNAGQATLPIINKSKWSGLTLVFPLLPEQQRIVAILDEAFESIAIAKDNAEKNLQNAREMFESYLQSVFTQRGEGWVEKRLGDVCVIKPPKSEARKVINPLDFVSFAPMEDLGIGCKYLNTTKTRPFDEVVGSYTYFIDGDVLLAKITPCFENGKLGIAQNLSNGVGFGSSEYIVFRTKSVINNEFLYYFLSRQQFRDEGEQRMSGAVGHKRVSKEFIENYVVPVPTIADQRTIVLRLDALVTETQRLESIYQQKITVLDELKKSLLQKAFNGEL